MGARGLFHLTIVSRKKTNRKGGNNGGGRGNTKLTLIKTKGGHSK